ncbi:MAG: hypothetical protein P8X63_01490 [Desulfuromonadaceae bacterium]
MLKNRLYLRNLVAIIVLLVLTGCQAAQPQPAALKLAPEAIYWQTERDYIGALAAYSVVYQGWQTDNKRGYNIGSVLLNDTSPDGRLVFWARNCNSITENETQHGEVRLMLGYLAKLHAARQQGEPVPDIKNLAGYTVYTTLEPCAQCAGMMTLQEVYRTVYGQSDPGFGKAIERLELDSSALPDGYPPYPRPVISERATIIYCDQLEAAYTEYQKQTGQQGHITDFLKSEPAKNIFAAAYDEFMSYEPKVPEINGRFLTEAKHLVNSVPASYVPLDPDI